MAKNPTVRRRVLGIELRRLRGAAGLTIEEVAAALDCSSSKVSRIETAKVGASARDVRDMLELYGVAEEQRQELLQAARDARKRGWWHAYNDVIPSTSAYVGLEAAADRIDTYEALLVPGLLQTADYSRAAIQVLHPKAGPHEIDRWLELRRARRARLEREDPLIVWAIVDEAALRRPVGGRGVMRQQLQRLVEDSGRSAVTIQVLPFSAGEHAALYGSFTILRFHGSALSDVVYLEKPVNDLLLEMDEELEYYSRAFECLQGLALDPVASNALLAELAKEQ